MSRQPISGAGAAVRAPSPSPSSALAPQPYRALRARYNALLVTLYERTSLTRREIAALAGHTENAIGMLVRELGCVPRNARTCRPGTNVGVRRAGPRPLPLNAPATRRVAAAFAGVARELAASAQARAASELQRATACAKRRTARTQTSIMTGAARSLTHLAAAIEDAAAARDALATSARRNRAERSQARKPATASRPRPLPDVRHMQERVLREQEARMWAAHQGARRAKAAAAPPCDADADRRIDEIAKRTGAGPRPGVRIRRLW